MDYNETSPSSSAWTMTVVHVNAASAVDLLLSTTHKREKARPFCILELVLFAGCLSAHEYALEGATGLGINKFTVYSCPWNDYLCQSW